MFWKLHNWITYSVEELSQECHHHWDVWLRNQFNLQAWHLSYLLAPSELYRNENLLSTSRVSYQKHECDLRTATYCSMLCSDLICICFCARLRDRLFSMTSSIATCLRIQSNAKLAQLFRSFSRQICVVFTLIQKQTVSICVSALTLTRFDYADCRTILLVRSHHSHC